ncbi:N-acetylglucosamine repressor [Paraliobacillus sp. PM-2]|uniref:ROK family transcriptional regulator n=1 Tax=Paraliobacillus sp. PM-2 TaxID=1462524 RepID=UPI00061C1FDC|nr:ROK family transcriptional regulator [Paraliobacillus sp. PM-2]CQR46061.1 N-acetylglucosamine repressor [Paraliobacillus sp. PM-2]
MQTGSFRWMKSLNKSIILNKILNSGPISRAQIAKETNLTPPTVGSIVKELIDQDIVKESTLGTSQGGRKPTMLVINYQGFYVVGVDAGPSEIETILTDLSGKVIEHHMITIDEKVTSDSFLMMLETSIDIVLQSYWRKKDKIIGIGVAMHGVVDVDTGTSLYAPNLDLRNIPIQKSLEDRFDLMVKVENDARALALGEVWFGQGKDTESMVAVNIGNGVGAGVAINGKLYHGDSSIAGEIGHMTVDMHGKRCSCGNKGCLQTVISGPAIAERAVEEFDTVQQSILKTLHSITGLDVYQAALEGDGYAIRLLEETGEYIGIGLTNLIHLINPTKIIIGGGVSAAQSFILDPIIKTIKKRALTPQAKQTQVVISDLGDKATALGAVALLLAELFERNGEVII